MFSMNVLTTRMPGVTRTLRNTEELTLNAQFQCQNKKIKKLNNNFTMYLSFYQTLGIFLTTMQIVILF